MRIERRLLIIETKRRRRGRTESPTAQQTDFLLPRNSRSGLAYGRPAIGKSQPIKQGANAARYLSDFAQKSNPSKI